MRKAPALLTALVAVALSAPAAAHDEAAPGEAGLRADLIANLDDAEKKLVALAEAIPQDKYGWRPSEGVRTDRWKYLRWVAEKPPAEELYDLHTDPHETTNLAHRPEGRDMLERLRGRWADLGRRLK